MHPSITGTLILTTRTHSYLLDAAASTPKQDFTHATHPDTGRMHLVVLRCVGGLKDMVDAAESIFAARVKWMEECAEMMDERMLV